MKHVAILPARQCGKTFTHLQTLEIRLLNALFDAPDPMSVTELETALRCTRRDLWRAIRQQAMLGNIKKGQPVALTSSARSAVVAGRMMQVAA